MVKQLRILTIPFMVLIASVLGANELDQSDDFFDEFDDEFSQTEETAHVRDPLIKYNRFMFKINDKLYRAVLKPLAQGYSKIIPENGRRNVGHFFENLAFPKRLVNNLLQLKIKRTGKECARFAINTTEAILGFRDVAKTKYDINEYREDFGQTLGHYRLEGGFVIVLPLLGVSNIRDTIGLIPDYFLNPPNYLDPDSARIGTNVATRINYLSLHIDEYDTILQDAIDPYTYTRDVIQKIRKSKIEK